MANTQESQIQHAIFEAKSGNRDGAKKILSEVIKGNPNNAHAWYVLSQVVEKPEQAIYCLEQVLKIQPDNEQAKQRIEKLQKSQKFKAITNKPVSTTSVKLPEEIPSEKPLIPQQSENIKSNSEKTKKCPFCAEVIKEEATICRFCGGNLLHSNILEPSTPPAQQIVNGHQSSQDKIPSSVNQTTSSDIESQDSIFSFRHLPIYLGCLLLLGTLLQWSETTKGDNVIETYSGLSQIPGLFAAIIAIVIILVPIIQPTKPGERSAKIPAILAIMTLIICLGWPIVSYHPCFAGFFAPSYVVPGAKPDPIYEQIYNTESCFRIARGTGYTLSMWTLFAIAVIGLIKNPKKKL